MNAGIKLREYFTALTAIAVGLLIYIVLSNLSGLLTIHDFTPMIGIAVSGAGLHIFSGWIVLAPVVLWLGRRFPVHPVGWLKSVSLHLLFLVVVAVVHALVNAWIYYSWETVSPAMQDYAPWQHAGHFLFQDDHFLFDAIIYAFLVASRNINHFYNQVKEQELDALKLESQLTEARLQALRMQVNPHFLFNTLNSIKVLVHKQETDAAEIMLQKLSDFFRQTLEAGTEQCVPLAREIDLMESYLEIERVRYGNRLSVIVDLPAACRTLQVPVLILQPLVENSIRHGLNTTQEKALIEIRACIAADQLVITVQDNGTGLSGCVEGSGTGIENIRMRLVRLFGDKAGIEIVNLQPQAGVQVVVSMPQVTAIQTANQNRSEHD